MHTCTNALTRTRRYVCTQHIQTDRHTHTHTPKKIHTHGGSPRHPRARKGTHNTFLQTIIQFASTQTHHSQMDLRYTSVKECRTHRKNLALWKHVRVNVLVYVYIYIHIHTYKVKKTVNAYVNTWEYICIYMYISQSISTYLHIYLYLYIYIHKCVYIYIHIHRPIYIATYRYVHTYIRTTVFKYHVCICVYIYMHSHVHIIVHAHVNRLFTHWLLYVHMYSNMLRTHGQYRRCLCMLSQCTHHLPLHASRASARMHLWPCTWTCMDGMARETHQDTQNSGTASVPRSVWYAHAQTYVASSTPATSPSWRPPILSFGTNFSLVDSMKGTWDTEPVDEIQLKLKHRYGYLEQLTSTCV